MQIDRWEMLFKTRAGALVDTVASSAARPHILGAEWEFSKNDGCGEASIQIMRDRLGSIDISNHVEIYATPIGGSRTLYYTGFIEHIDQPGSDKNVLTLKANGVWRQAETIVVVEYYAGQDIDDIVTDLLSDYNSIFDVSNSTSEISISSPYTLADLEQEYVRLSELIKLLAEVQGDVQYGIDQNKKLYFKDLDTSVVDRYHAGLNVSDLEITKHADNLINEIVMQSKTMVGGGNLTLVRSDSTSKSSYGTKSTIVQLPELDPDDIWQWAGQMLAETKDPHTTVNTGVLPLSDFVFPRGQIEVTDRDGATHTLPIEKVRYSLDPVAGLSCRMELGDRPQVTLADEMRRIFRGIQTSKQQTISNVKIEHTRGQEWSQTANNDAGQQGNHNRFTDAFDTKKAIDEDLSFHILFDKDRNYMGCPFDRSLSRIVTSIIPSGQETDTIRVHADCDFYGRINFAFDEDLDDFWLNTTNWEITEGKSAVTNINSSDYLFYKDDETFDFPQEYKLRFRANFLRAATGVTCQMVFNYQDASNRCWVRWLYGATFMSVQLFEQTSGGGTNQRGSTLTGFNNQDLIIELTARNSPTNTTVEVFDTDDNSLGTITGTLAMTANNRVGPHNFYGGGGGPVSEVDYFEIQEIGDIDIWVSRDGGTTWTQATIVHGPNNVNVNVSGQPSGTDIRIKGEMTHPGRLYGWGVSFKN